MPDLEALVSHIDQPGIDKDPALDIVKVKPDITQVEALAVQLAVKRRREAEGDRIIGHQASFTSAAMRSIFPDAPRPMVGTLLASLARESGEQVELETSEVFVESEIALLLKKDLEGPALTASEILAATEAFLPAIEIAPSRPGVRAGLYSWPHMIAVQKAVGGFVVFGPRLTSPRAFDARLEGCLVSVDGEVRAGAVGYEAMGSPLTVVAAVARGLHAVGEKLRAGQVVMTGSIAPPQPVTAAHRQAQLEFQTLGSVSVRFSHGFRIVERTA